MDNLCFGIVPKDQVDKAPLEVVSEANNIHDDMPKVVSEEHYAINKDPVAEDHVVGHSQVTETIVVEDLIDTKVHNTYLIQTLLTYDQVLHQCLIKVIMFWLQDSYLLGGVEKPKDQIQWLITHPKSNPLRPLKFRSNDPITR